MSEEQYIPITLHNLPVTPTIPYNYRWRILQLKLMLADLKELNEKHGIRAARELMDVVAREAELFLEKLKGEIMEKRELIERVRI